MGCCYGCRDFLEKAEADLSASLIASESNEILKQASTILTEIKDILSGPSTHGSVPNWDKGESDTYVWFFKALVREKNKTGEAQLLTRAMTAKHYEAALTGTVHFYSDVRKTNPSFPQSPDTDWPLVVINMANREDDLRKIEAKLIKCKDSFEIHVRNAKTTKQQIESKGDNKIAIPKETDDAADAKIKEAEVLMKKALEVAGESRLLLRAFYVEVPEAELKEWEEQVRQEVARKESEKAALEKKGVNGK